MAYHSARSVRQVIEHGFAQVSPMDREAETVAAKLSRLGSMVMSLAKSCVYEQGSSALFDIHDALMVAWHCHCVCSGARVRYTEAMRRHIQTALLFGYAQHVHDVAHRATACHARGAHILHRVELLDDTARYDSALPELDSRVSGQVCLCLYSGICRPEQALSCALAALRVVHEWRSYGLCSSLQRMFLLPYRGHNQHALRLCICLSEQDATELLFGFGVQAVRKLTKPMQQRLAEAQICIMHTALWWKKNPHELIQGPVADRVLEEAHAQLKRAGVKIKHNRKTDLRSLLKQAISRKRKDLAKHPTQPPNQRIVHALAYQNKPTEAQLQRAIDLFSTHAPISPHNSACVQTTPLPFDATGCALIALALNLCTAGGHTVAPDWTPSNLGVPHANTVQTQWMARNRQYMKHKTLRRTQCLPSPAKRKRNDCAEPNQRLSNEPNQRLSNNYAEPNPLPWLATPSDIDQFVRDAWSHTACPRARDITQFVIHHLSPYGTCDCPEHHPRRFDLKVLLMIIGMPPSQPNLRATAEHILAHQHIPPADIAEDLDMVLAVWPAHPSPALLERVIQVLRAAHTCRRCRANSVLTSQQWTALLRDSASPDLRPKQQQLVTQLMRLLYADLTRATPTSEALARPKLDLYAAIRPFGHLQSCTGDATRCRRPQCAPCAQLAAQQDADHNIRAFADTWDLRIRM